MNFSIKAYVERYADLKKAFTVHIPARPVMEGIRFVMKPAKTEINYAAALNHWFTNGRKEGRSPKPLTAAERGAIAAKAREAKAAEERAAAAQRAREAAAARKAEDAERAIQRRFEPRF